jgi:hypothetical protein
MMASGTAVNEKISGGSGDGVDEGCGGRIVGTLVGTEVGVSVTTVADGEGVSLATAVGVGMGVSVNGGVTVTRAMLSGTTTVATVVTAGLPVLTFVSTPNSN